MRRDCNWISHRCSAASLSSIVVMLLLSGCGGDDVPPPPTSNRDVVSGSGEFVGHLKPNAHMAQSEEDPVVWVVRDGNVTRRDDSTLVHAFRLDWNELEPLSEKDFPYPLMTESTHEIVIHRGDPGTHVFTHPDINDGERCLTVHHCANPECPRFKELENLALFPHDPAAGEAVCPFCNSGDATGVYVVPQKAAMERFLDRKK